jgi:hypothetical protein
MTDLQQDPRTPLKRCEWCEQYGMPEWSYSANVWIHRLPRLDRRCENPPGQNASSGRSLADSERGGQMSTPQCSRCGGVHPHAQGMCLLRIGPKRRIKMALGRVLSEISLNAQRGHLAGALASEGYAGGYADALMDVDLLLRGMIPDRRGYWLSEARTHEPFTETNLEGSAKEK